MDLAAGTKGADGKPLVLLPHTADEQAFDDAHNGTPCPVGSDCGARHTAWPASAVVNPATGQALVFYQKENTEPGGVVRQQWLLHRHLAKPRGTCGASPLRPELADPTVMFPDGEP